MASEAAFGGDMQTHSEVVPQPLIIKRVGNVLQGILHMECQQNIFWLRFPCF